MVSVWGDKLNKKELERRRLVEEREAVCKEIESLITDVREAEEDYQEQGVEMQINLLQRVAELVKSNADYVSGLLAHKETPFAKVYNDNAKASDIPFTFEEPPPKSAHSGEDANEAAEDAKATPAHKTPAEAATENGGDHGVELAGDVVQERSHVSKKHQKRRRSKTSDGVRVKLSDLQMSHCNEQLLPLTTLLEGLEGLHVVGNVFMNNLLSAEAVHLCHDNDALKKSISLLRSAKKGLERDAVALRGVATYHTVTNYDLGRLIRLLEHCDASVRSMFDDQVRLNRWSNNFSEESALDLADTVDTMKRISMKFASLQVEGGRTVTLDDLNPATVTEQFDRAWISATDVAQLQGIPLEQLINLVLCCSPGTMPLYDLVLRTFFMTLEYYMSSGLFLERLMLRYCIVPDAALVRDLEKEAPVLLKRKHQTPVRKQVLKLLRYWLANFFFRDFFLNAANLQMVTNFIGHTVVPTGNKGEGQALLKLIEQAVEDNARAAEEREKQFREVEQEVEAEAGSVQKLRVYKPTITDNYLKNKLKSFVQEPVRPLAMVGLPAGESVVASALLLLEVDVQDLAHQITLMESKCYADIQIRELLQQVWNNKQRRDTAAPTLMWVFRHFNSVSRWIVDALLSEREARRRARVMRRVLLLAMHLLAMNNYNGLMEVMSGINSTAVDRLWATWHAVGPQLYAVKELLSTLTLSSLKMYRYQWSTTLAPCVPYIGLSLTDLTFFEDGNPSFLTAKKGNKQKLLNFQKFLKVEKTISGLLHYQDFPYSLPYCPKVYNPLADTLDQLARQPLSDEDTYERSTACEPQEVTQPFKKKLSALQTEFDISKPEEFIKEFHKLRQHVFLEKEVISVHPSPLTEAPVPIAKLPRHVRFSENPSDDPTLVRVLVDSSTLLDIAADLRDELPGKTCRWCAHSMLVLSLVLVARSLAHSFSLSLCPASRSRFLC